MEKAEINAVLGIDVDAATNSQLLLRAVEVCAEMADCYEPYSLEAETFSALWFVFCRLTGEVDNDEV